jgi:tRNA(Arg) A34 adenosine deaminase TadA
VVSSEIWDLAIKAAWRSFARGDVGIGAVFTGNDDSIIVGENRSFGTGANGFEGSPIAHAEIDALRFATNRTARGGRLFSTLQPCLMCTGAALMAGIQSVEFLAPDPAWPEPAAFTSLAIQWPGAKTRFGQARSEMASLSLLLPLVTFAERMKPEDFAVFNARFPSHALAAQRYAQNGEARRIVQSSDFSPTAAAALLNAVDPNDLVA